MKPAPDDLASRVRTILAENRVDAAGGRYTRPARGTYPHQWLWDSCFHAILHDVLGDRRAAHDELRALFRAQEKSGPDRGRLPHMTFVGSSPREAAQDEQGAAAYARDVALWKNASASTITQPPIVAEAVLRVGGKELYEELWGPLSAYYDWWLRRRDPDGDRLYASWHVWECGADATPRADPACDALLASGRVARFLSNQTVNPTAKKRDDLLNARFLMLEDLQEIDEAELGGRMGEEEAQARRTRLFGHEGVDMQAYLVRNLLDLATIGDAIGRVSEAAAYREASAAISHAVNAKLWDDRAGFYFDVWGEAEEPLRVLSPAPFVALYAGDLVPRDRAERLLAHLLDERSFWTRWPVPTIARNSDEFDADEYWRGSTWLCVNWFIVRGLILSAARFEDGRWLATARALAERSLDLTRHAGFREYYRSGAKTPAGDSTIAPMGFGPDDFSWSGLALDFDRMLRTDLA